MQAHGAYNDAHVFARNTPEARRRFPARPSADCREVWDPQRKRSRVQIVYSCGRADDPVVAEGLRRLARSILRRCLPEEIVSEDPSWRVVDTWPYGEVYVLEQLWARLGMAEVIGQIVAERRFDFPLERAWLAMVANRACAPSSKLYCYEQWLREEVRLAGTGGLELHHLYRAMDLLEASKEAIEKALYFRLADLLNLDVELIFYDTTSVHFESDEEDEGSGEGDEVGGSVCSGAKTYRAPRKRGKSKDGRDDAPQIVVGLAVTRDGFPVRHWVFPGNTVDVTTVAKVQAELKDWRLVCVRRGCGDGLGEESQGVECEWGPLHRVHAHPPRRGGRPGGLEPPWTLSGGRREPARQGSVVGEGERRRRYIVCHNPQEEARQRAHRERVLATLEAELESLRHHAGEAHSKRLCALRAIRRYGRYLKLTPTGKPLIDQAKVKAAERLDGKFVVHSNDDTLSAEDMALGYKQLQRVEEAWRRLKSGLRLCPIFHWAVHRIQAHVALSVLALLLERMAEHACADTWRNIRDDLKRIKLAQLLSPNGTLWQVTEPPPEALKRLKSLQLKNPPPLLQIT